VAVTNENKNTKLAALGLTIEDIKDLMSHMKTCDTSTLSIGEGESSIKIERESRLVSQSFAPILSPHSEKYDLVTESTEKASADAVPQGHAVTSPVVGVFYDAASPEAEPFVKVGDYVKAGAVLCIIEAMKLMNEVTSPISGIVTEIKAEKACRVEFGEILFMIEPAVPTEDAEK